MLFRSTKFGGIKNRGSFLLIPRHYIKALNYLHFLFQIRANLKLTGGTKQSGCNSHCSVLALVDNEAGDASKGTRDVVGKAGI